MREASSPQEPAPAAAENGIPSEGPVPPSAEEAEPSPESAPTENVETVDCSRIDDPSYRKQVEASGIDPDSIDCSENDTGG